MLKSLKNFGALYLIAFGTLWLVRFPLADCFDCEGPGAWGRNDHVYAERSLAFEIIFVLSSFVAGLFQIRLGWLVPIALSIADVLTMRLAGAEWWSIRNNEGPIAFIFDLLIGAVFLASGLGINLLTNRLKSKRSISPSLE
jgi:hypothetical protein